ncbi:RNA-binding S4 domain [Trinorchestia longiramus]|nr:RNA-binding S4 domain [Trinorchestia longiramus]
MIKDLDKDDPFRDEYSAKCIEKMYTIGIIPMKGSLELVNNTSASSFCRRRLGCVMVKNGMVERISVANNLIKHGHVRVGMDVVKDPAFLVPRALEDYITWVDSSSIKRKIMEYNEGRDDYTLLNC